MSARLRAAIVASVIWTGLLQPVPAAPPRTADSSVQLPRHLSSDNVLAILLLLLSREDAQMRPTLQKLYEASFISTEPQDGRELEWYLSRAYIGPLKDEVSGSVFAALMDYQKLIAAEIREDKRLSAARLRASTVRIASELRGPSLTQFVDRAESWLRTVESALQGTADADLEMLQLQELLTQRQRAIALAASLMKALNGAAQQVAANLGPAPSTQSEASSSDSDSDACGHCSP